MKNNDHAPHCRCTSCLTFKRVCCGVTCSTYPAYLSHLRSELHKRTVTRERNVVVVPEGLGYLQSLFGDKIKLQTVSTAAVRRFAEILKDHNAKSKARFTDKDRHDLRDINEGTLFQKTVGVFLLGDQLKAVYTMAEACGVPPSKLLSLLVSYGLEYLAKELRMQSAAPGFKDPRTTLNAKLTPRTESVARDELRTTGEVDRSAQLPPILPGVHKKEEIKAMPAGESGPDSTDCAVRADPRRYIPRP